MEMEMNLDDASNYLTTGFTHPPATAATPHKNSGKKRAKPSTAATSGAAAISDPRRTGPKITRPCTECGKKFWSWKALFGHMRCHPERRWRGINPPPNFRHRRQETTEEDSEMAACLLMLANGPPAPALMPAAQQQHCCSSSAGGLNNCLFECSGCKKVFGSHQALGGHRASHKNVKGCYAINKQDGDHHDHHHHPGIVRDIDDEDDGHKCTICLRVFTSGQALGGHMRCHWEKASVEGSSRVSHAFDLNIPAGEGEDDDDASAVYSSIVIPENLDLRLGL